MTNAERFRHLGRKRYFRSHTDRLRYVGSYLSGSAEIYERVIGIALCHLIDTGRLTIRAEETINAMTWPAVLRTLDSMDCGNYSVDSVQKGFYRALGCKVVYI